MPKADATYGKPTPGQSIYEAELVERAVVLDNKNVRRDHQLHQNEREQNLATKQFPAGQREGSERANDELPSHDAKHQHNRVDEVPRERRGIPGPREIVPGRGKR